MVSFHEKKLRIGNIILFLPGAGFGLLFLPAQPPFDLGKHHVHCVYQITCLHRHFHSQNGGWCFCDHPSGCQQKHFKAGRKIVQHIPVIPIRQLVSADQAINKGLYPVSKFIELHYVKDGKRNFFTEWNDAFTEQYAYGSIYQSEQQKQLVNFFSKKPYDTISAIAPTSYGKSELILSTVKEFAGRKICVLTSTKALLIQTKKRIQQISKSIFPKIVVHPEMYNPKI